MVSNQELKELVNDIKNLMLKKLSDIEDLSAGLYYGSLFEDQRICKLKKDIQDSLSCFNVDLKKSFKDFEEVI